ncbi:MAG: hypothetical protein FWG11_05620, partial [Promicromonosporaceae bacterium]|nr:hypothetical protein [Promicromonosporaceae bacterium]
MWRPNPATVALGVIGVVIAALGLWTGRADVLAFGVAPIVAAFTLTGHRPEFATGQRFVEAPSEAGVFAADLTLEPADEAALLLVRAFAPGHRPRTVAVAARPARHLSLQARSARTGPSRTFDVQARAISQGAA